MKRRKYSDEFKEQILEECRQKVIQEISDSEKYEDIFDEKTIRKLQNYEEKLTKSQKDELYQKISLKREEYNEMSTEDIRR